MKQGRVAPRTCVAQISSNKEGTKWTGKCWYIHNLLKYEFDLQFEIPVSATKPSIGANCPRRPEPEFYIALCYTDFGFVYLTPNDPIEYHPSC
eukprot:1196340-Prorocentrum_minimum.AAC.5